MVIAELLATDLESVERALRAGADRIELCAALEVGGVTPGIGFLGRAVRAAHEPQSPPFTSAGVVALIRPRRGDFVLDGHQGLDLLVDEVLAAKEAGVEGVALGVLDGDRRINLPALRVLVSAARPLRVTFHRAFDHVVAREPALDQLLEAGVDRLLTSGGAPSALEGAEALRALVDQAGSGLEVIAAGGIQGNNAAEVIERTGVPAIHGSCSVWVQGSGAPGSLVPMGAMDSGSPESGRYKLDADSSALFVAAAHGSIQAPPPGFDPGGSIS